MFWGFTKSCGMLFLIIYILFSYRWSPGLPLPQEEAVPCQVWRHRCKAQGSKWSLLTCYHQPISIFIHVPPSIPIPPSCCQADSKPIPNWPTFGYSMQCHVMCSIVFCCQSGDVTGILGSARLKSRVSKIHRAWRVHLFENTIHGLVIGIVKSP